MRTAGSATSETFDRGVEHGSDLSRGGGAVACGAAGFLFSTGDVTHRDIDVGDGDFVVHLGVDPLVLRCIGTALRRIGIRVRHGPPQYDLYG